MRLFIAAIFALTAKLASAADISSTRLPFLGCPPRSPFYNGTFDHGICTGMYVAAAPPADIYPPLRDIVSNEEELSTPLYYWNYTFTPEELNTGYLELSIAPFLFSAVDSTSSVIMVSVETGSADPSGGNTPIYTAESHTRSLVHFDCPSYKAGATKETNKCRPARILSLTMPRGHTHGRVAIGVYTDAAAQVPALFTLLPNVPVPSFETASHPTNAGSYGTAELFDIFVASPPTVTEALRFYMILSVCIITIIQGGLVLMVARDKVFPSYCKSHHKLNSALLLWATLFFLAPIALNYTTMGGAMLLTDMHTMIMMWQYAGEAAIIGLILWKTLADLAMVVEHIVPRAKHLGWLRLVGTRNVATGLSMAVGILYALFRYPASAYLFPSLDSGPTFKGLLIATVVVCAVLQVTAAALRFAVIFTHERHLKRAQVDDGGSKPASEPDELISPHRLEGATKSAFVFNKWSAFMDIFAVAIACALTGSFSETAENDDVPVIIVPVLVEFYVLLDIVIWGSHGTQL